MLTVMRIAIIGTGAIGAFYGACLDRAGHECWFLGRSDVAAIVDKGLRVASPTGDMHLQPCRVTDEPTAIPPCDAVLVTIKTTGNSDLPRLLQVPLTETGIVCCLQNGLDNEAEIARLLPAERVCGGLCFVCCNRLAPGEVVHLDYGNLMLGSHRPGPPPAALAELAAAWRQSGLTVDFLPDLAGARWRKLVWNVPYNGLSVLLDATTDRLVADAGLRQLVDELMQEVRAAAAAHGFPIEDDFLAEMVARTNAMKPYATSMLLDRRAGRRLEVEHIFGNPVRAAAEVGVAVPRMAMLYRQLAALDGMLVDHTSA